MESEAEEEAAVEGEGLRSDRKWRECGEGEMVDGRWLGFEGDGRWSGGGEVTGAFCFGFFR